MNERTVILERPPRTWRTPLGDKVTVRKFVDQFDRPVEHVTLECPLELIEVGQEWQV